jgi:hypothetical protein
LAQASLAFYSCSTQAMRGGGVSAAWAYLLEIVGVDEALRFCRVDAVAHMG